MNEQERAYAEAAVDSVKAAIHYLKAGVNRLTVAHLTITAEAVDEHLEQLGALLRKFEQNLGDQS